MHFSFNCSNQFLVYISIFNFIDLLYKSTHNEQATNAF